MKPDRVPGWRAIERISVGARHGWNPSMVRATRWVAPTGAEATIVTRTSLGSPPNRVPAIVSAPAVARDAGLSAGKYVLDPQLCWHDIDERHFLVSPALGIRMSVKAPRDGHSRRLGFRRRRLCRVFIELLATGPHPLEAHTPADWMSLGGTHLGVVTRWRIPATALPEPAAPPRMRAARLTTGPAAFLRDDHDDPVGVG